MSNIKMNLFEHYSQEGCLPIENNISRILARILNENVYIFSSFINKINEKSNTSLGTVKTKYNVDFQRTVKDINVDCYNKVVGVALTAIELQEECSNEEVNENLITDIIIENFNDTLIIIEVKRTNENCMYQLDKQIKSIIDGKDIDYEKVSMKWEDIVEVLGNYIKFSKQKDIVVEDYYEYLKHYYKQWFPVTSFSECDNQEFINNRVDRLLQNIQNVSNRVLEQEGKRLKVNNWGWTNQLEIDTENMEYLKIKMWPGDSGQQFYKLMPKTSLKFVTKSITNLKIVINNIEINASVNVQPYLKVSNAFAGWIASGNLDMQYYKEKADYENIFNSLHGRWFRNADEHDFIRDKRSFIQEISSLKLLNKDYFMERIHYILNNTNRKQISVSLGFYVEVNIPLEKLKEVDSNFSSKNDVDELAKPLYELIMQCKNIIEQ